MLLRDESLGRRRTVKSQVLKKELVLKKTSNKKSVKKEKSEKKERSENKEKRNTKKIVNKNRVSSQQRRAITRMSPRRMSTRKGSQQEECKNKSVNKKRTQ